MKRLLKALGATCLTLMGSAFAAYVFNADSGAELYYVGSFFGGFLSAMIAQIGD